MKMKMKMNNNKILKFLDVINDYKSRYRTSRIRYTQTYILK